MRIVSEDAHSSVAFLRNLFLISTQTEKKNHDAYIYRYLISHRESVRTVYCNNSMQEKTILIENTRFKLYTEVINSLWLNLQKGQLAHAHKPQPIAKHIALKFHTFFLSNS